MNCRKTRLLMSAFVDGELSGAEMLCVRSHASQCEVCDRELAELAHLKRLMGELPTPEPSDALASKIMASVRESDAVVHPKVKLRWSVLAGGMAVLAAGYAFAVLSRPFTEPVQTVDRFEPRSTIDLRQDRAYASGGDPFSGAPMVVPVSR